METPEVLLTLAEVSIAYVGFAALFGILSSRAEEWPGEVQLMFRALIEVGLVLVFLSLAPVVLALCHIDAPDRWLFASLIAMVTLLGNIGWRIHQIRTRLGHFPREAPVAIPMVVVNLVLYAGNAVIWREPGPYVIALVNGLAGASLIFLAMVYRMFPIVRR